MDLSQDTWSPFSGVCTTNGRIVVEILNLISCSSISLFQQMKCLIFSQHVKIFLQSV